MTPSGVDFGSSYAESALAGRLRPSAAGANDAADQIGVAQAAIAQLSVELVETPESLLRVDTAGATHDLIGWCRDAKIRYCVGYDLTEQVRDATLQLPADTSITWHRLGAISPVSPSLV